MTGPPHPLPPTPPLSPLGQTQTATAFLMRSAGWLCTRLAAASAALPCPLCLQFSTSGTQPPKRCCSAHLRLLASARLPQFACMPPPACPPRSCSPPAPPRPPACGASARRCPAHAIQKRKPSACRLLSSAASSPAAWHEEAAALLPLAAAAAEGGGLPHGLHCFCKLASPLFF